MSMYDLFRTDETLEKSGVVVDYGDFRVTLARAGGANKKFAKILEAKTKPFRRAMQTGTMDNDRGMSLLKEVYAEAVVLNWEVKEGDGWKQGIEGPDGSIQAFNRENVIAAFEELPDLFADIQEQANKVAIYRQTVLEEDAKN